MWTQKSAKPELWRRRCYSEEAIHLAGLVAWRAYDDVVKAHPDVVLVREPKVMIVVDSLGKYAVVTMRVRYAPETNLQYSKRFFRAYPKPPEVALK